MPALLKSLNEAVASALEHFVFALKVPFPDMQILRVGIFMGAAKAVDANRIEAIGTNNVIRFMILRSLIMCPTIQHNGTLFN